MSNIATLGLEFKSGTAGSQIKTLCNRFDTLEKKCGSVQQALDKLFGALPGKISASSTAIGKLNSGLVNIARFSGAANASLTQINSILAGMSKRKIDPVGAAAAKKAADLTLAMQNLANVMTKIPTNKLNFNPVVNNTNRLGNSVNALGGHADVASIALRSLQGALSINYLKNAVVKTIELGTELAYIKSIAMELNTNQIGSSLMNFSSMLGGPAENAEALYYAYSSGIRGTEEDFIKFTEIASKTAQVNRATLKPMIDAMTAAMNAYGMSVDRAGEVADNFFAIVKYGKASGEQLANSFGQVSPTAKTLGVTLDELGAGIASLTKIQPTRVAITGLNNMLSKIMKPTKESRLALEKLGVDMSYSAVQSKGFVTVLREVHDALGGNMDALKNIFPDIRGQRAAMHLLGTGWGDFNIQLDNFANKKDAMDTAFKVLTDDVNVQLKQIPVTLNKITTEAGSMATSMITLGGSLTPVIASFNNMGEGPRKMIAAMTLLVSGYAAYKAILLAVNTYHAIQMKNNQILGVQAAANVKAIQFQTMAHYRLARAKASTAAAAAALAKVQAAAANQNALDQVLLADYIEQQYHYALSIGDTSAAMALHLQLKQQMTVAAQADAAALAAETNAIRAQAAAHALNTESIQAENVAKAANTATSTMSAIANIASTGAGFTAGFKAMFDTAAFAKSITMVSSTMAVGTAIAAMFGKAITFLGAVLGKVATVFTTIFSLVNIAIAGVVAIVAVGIDYLQSWIRTGKAWGEGSKSLTQTMMNGIVDWATGASKKAKQQETNLAKIYEMMDERKAIAGFGKRIQDRFNHLFDDLKEKEKSEPERFTDTADSYNDALENFQKSFGEDQIAAATKAADDASKKAIQLSAQLLGGGKAREELSEEEEQALAAAEKAMKNANEHLRKLEEGATELQDKLRGYGEKLYDMVKAQQNAVLAVGDMEKAQNFKMMSPDQQLAETRRRYSENGKAYFDAVESGNSEAAQKSFQALIGDYNTLRDSAMKKIEENRKLTEKLQKMRDDALLNAAPADSAKYALYQKRMTDSFNESMAKARSGDYSGAADSYQKSYEAAAQMASMQNKLAQAEMNANDKTRQMILSLDKFKTSAVGVVNANSSDALKLQSRRFDALPAYQPQNTQQNIAAQQNQAMAQSMTQFTGWLQKMVDQDTQKQQSEQGYYDNLWKQIGDANKENLGNIETALSQIINQLTGKMRVTVDNGFNIKSVRL